MKKMTFNQTEILDVHKFTFPEPIQLFAKQLCAKTLNANPLVQYTQVFIWKKRQSVDAVRFVMNEMYKTSGP